MKLEDLARLGAHLTGHFLLSAGGHSDQYIQCAILMSKYEGKQLVLKELAKKIPEEFININKTIGPAMGGIKFADKVADVINEKRIKMGLAPLVEAIYPERRPEIRQDKSIAHIVEQELLPLVDIENGRISFKGKVGSEEHEKNEAIFNATVRNNYSVVSGKFQLRRGFEIRPGEKVLICEDVTTTGRSIGEVAELVKKHDGEIVGAISIIDRRDKGHREHTICGYSEEGGFGFYSKVSPIQEINVKEIPFISLIQLDINTWKPEECPLCKEGVDITKPGSRK